MEIKLLSADEMDRIFGEGLKIHGLTDRCGVSSLTVLKDVFVMMKRKLMQLGSSDDDEENFVHAIKHAIKNAPELAPNEKVELRDTLRSAFDGFHRQTTITSANSNFLDRVRFDNPPRPENLPPS